MVLVVDAQFSLDPLLPAVTFKRLRKGFELTLLLELLARGSKYKLFKDSSSKYHALNGFGDQSP